MLEGVVARILDRLLGEFFHVDREQLKLRVWKGNVSLKNLEFNAEALERFDMPFRVIHGSLALVQLHIPWKQLNKEPVEVVLDSLVLRLAPRKLHEDSTLKQLDALQAKRRAVLDAEQLRDEPLEEEDEEEEDEEDSENGHHGKNGHHDHHGGMDEGTQSEGEGEREADKTPQQSRVGRIVQRVMDNLRVSIRNVSITVEDEGGDSDPFTMGVHLGELSVFTADSAGQRTFVSEASPQLRKCGTIGDVRAWWAQGLCPESAAPAASSGDAHRGGAVNIAGPLYGSITVDIVRRAHTMSVRSMAVHAQFKQVAVCAHDAALSALARLGESVSEHAYFATIAPLRPRATVRESPRAWMRFAVKAVMIAGRMHRGENTSWSRVVGRLRTLRAYAALFKRKVGASRPWISQLSKDEENRIAALERDLDIPTTLLLAWRRVARRELEIEEDNYVAALANTETGRASSTKRRMFGLRRVARSEASLVKRVEKKGKPAELEAARRAAPVSDAQAFSVIERTFRATPRTSQGVELSVDASIEAAGIGVHALRFGPLLSLQTSGIRCGLLHTPLPLGSREEDGAPKSAIKVNFGVRSVQATVSGMKEPLLSTVGQATRDREIDGKGDKDQGRADLVDGTLVPGQQLRVRVGGVVANIDLLTSLSLVERFQFRAPTGVKRLASAVATSAGGAARAGAASGASVEVDYEAPVVRILVPEHKRGLLVSLGRVGLHARGGDVQASLRDLRVALEQDGKELERIIAPWGVECEFESGARLFQAKCAPLSLTWSDEAHETVLALGASMSRGTPGATQAAEGPGIEAGTRELRSRALSASSATPVTRRSSSQYSSSGHLARGRSTGAGEDPGGEKGESSRSDASNEPDAPSAGVTARISVPRLDLAWSALRLGTGALLVQHSATGILDISADCGGVAVSSGLRCAWRGLAVKVSGPGQVSAQLRHVEATEHGAVLFRSSVGVALSAGAMDVNIDTLDAVVQLHALARAVHVLPRGLFGTGTSSLSADPHTARGAHSVSDRAGQLPGQNSAAAELHGILEERAASAAVRDDGDKSSAAVQRIEVHARRLRVLLSSQVCARARVDASVEFESGGGMRAAVRARLAAASSTEGGSGAPLLEHADVAVTVTRNAGSAVDNSTSMSSGSHASRPVEGDGSSTPSIDGAIKERLSATVSVADAVLTVSPLQLQALERAGIELASGASALERAFAAVMPADEEPACRDVEGVLPYAADASDVDTSDGGLDEPAGAVQTSVAADVHSLVVFLRGDGPGWNAPLVECDIPKVTVQVESGPNVAHSTKRVAASGRAHAHTRASSDSATGAATSAGGAHGGGSSSRVRQLTKTPSNTSLSSTSSIEPVEESARVLTVPAIVDVDAMLSIRYLHLGRMVFEPLLSHVPCRAMVARKTDGDVSVEVGVGSGLSLTLSESTIQALQSALAQKPIASDSCSAGRTSPSEVSVQGRWPVEVVNASGKDVILEPGHILLRADACAPARFTVGTCGVVHGDAVPQAALAGGARKSFTAISSAHSANVSAAADSVGSGGTPRGNSAADCAGGAGDAAAQTAAQEGDSLWPLRAGEGSAAAEALETDFAGLLSVERAFDCRARGPVASVSTGGGPLLVRPASPDEKAAPPAEPNASPPSRSDNTETRCGDTDERAQRTAAAAAAAAGHGAAHHGYAPVRIDLGRPGTSGSRSLLWHVATRGITRTVTLRAHRAMRIAMGVPVAVRMIARYDGKGMDSSVEEGTQYRVVWEITPRLAEGEYGSAVWIPLHLEDSAAAAASGAPSAGGSAGSGARAGDTAAAPSRLVLEARAGDNDQWRTLGNVHEICRGIHARVVTLGCGSACFASRQRDQRLDASLTTSLTVRSRLPCPVRVGTRVLRPGRRVRLPADVLPALTCSGLSSPSGGVAIRGASGSVVVPLGNGPAGIAVSWRRRWDGSAALTLSCSAIVVNKTEREILVRQHGHAALPAAKTREGAPGGAAALHQRGTSAASYVRIAASNSVPLAGDLHPLALSVNGVQWSSAIPVAGALASGPASAGEVAFGVSLSLQELIRVIEVSPRVVIWSSLPVALHLKFHEGTEIEIPPRGRHALCDARAVNGPARVALGSYREYSGGISLDRMDAVAMLVPPRYAVSLDVAVDRGTIHAHFAAPKVGSTAHDVPHAAVADTAATPAPEPYEHTTARSDTAAGAAKGIGDALADVHDTGPDDARGGGIVVRSLLSVPCFVSQTGSAVLVRVAAFAEDALFALPEPLQKREIAIDVPCHRQNLRVALIPGSEASSAPGGAGGGAPLPAAFSRSAAEASPSIRCAVDVEDGNLVIVVGAHGGERSVPADAVAEVPAAVSRGAATVTSMHAPDEEEILRDTAASSRPADSAQRGAATEAGRAAESSPALALRESDVGRGAAVSQRDRLDGDAPGESQRVGAVPALADAAGSAESLPRAPSERRSPRAPRPSLLLAVATPSLSLSVVHDATAREIAMAHLGTVASEISRNGDGSVGLSLSVASLQVDAPCAVGSRGGFEVLVERAAGEGGDERPVIEAALALGPPSVRMQHIRYASLAVQALDVRVAAPWLDDLVDFGRACGRAAAGGAAASLTAASRSRANPPQPRNPPQQHGARANTRERERAHASVHSRMVYMEEMTLHPLRLYVTVDMDGGEHVAGVLRPIGLVLGSVNRAPVAAKALAMERAFLSEAAVHEMVRRHYMNEVLQRALLLFGSIEILGDPVALVSDVASSIKELFYAPATALVHNPRDIGASVVRGTAGVITSTISSTFGSVTKVTRSAAKGVAALSLDDEFARGRNRSEAKHAAHGLGLGLLGLGKGVFDGVSGLVAQPMREIRSEAKANGKSGGNKFGAALRGFGKGIAGLAFKPAAAAIDLASKTTEGISNTFRRTSRAQRMRDPRLIIQHRPLEEYSPRSASAMLALARYERRRGKPSGRILAWAAAANEENSYILTREALLELKPDGNIVRLIDVPHRRVKSDPERIDPSVSRREDDQMPLKGVEFANPDHEERFRDAVHSLVLTSSIRISEVDDDDSDVESVIFEDESDDDFDDNVAEERVFVSEQDIAETAADWDDGLLAGDVGASSYREA